MSTIKEIEEVIRKYNEFVYTGCGNSPKLEFHQGSTINGVTHKIFKVYPDNIIELTREKHTKDLLKWLEGYYQSLWDNFHTFRNNK